MTRLNSASFVNMTFSKASAREGHDFAILAKLHPLLITRLNSSGSSRISTKAMTASLGNTSAT